MVPRFDDSLTILVAAVTETLGPEAAKQGVFLREAGGKLSFVADSEVSESDLSRVTLNVREALGPYARDVEPVRDRNSPGARRILAEAGDRTLVKFRGDRIRFIDRRLVGADWLLQPRNPTGIPKIAFCSLKGGVGRSTALAVAAAYLSGRGQRVLAVDLDLEAPGIGTMLVEPAAQCAYGSLDYLVENGLSGINSDFLREMVANSYLGQSGGQVSVVPAIGTVTLNAPENALAKIARAYLEDVDSETGKPRTLTDQVSWLVDELTRSGSYDVVLIDGRAGLHESSAPVMLGLGAEVLLFGIDEPQTYAGYRMLLAHMAQFDDHSYADWRKRVTFVHAKSSAAPQSLSDANSRFLDLLRTEGEQGGADAYDEFVFDEDDFDLDWSDVSDEELDDIFDADESSIVTIFDDSRYAGFNPLAERSLLNSELFSSTFGELIMWLDARIPTLR